jgi:hypothetical protein
MCLHNQVVNLESIGKFKVIFFSMNRLNKMGLRKMELHHKSEHLKVASTAQNLLVQYNFLKL